ncbi:hypothetical protein LU298_00200 [Komagataeibacter intermedius]|uniref:TIGR02646 family protein n=1 Tax=Komagataeibacter intermedius NRIC 0521 TaxID=1307934 RepID=A0ABQ0PH52_9PROT|nr:hypothetical protein [Komagataeibacter intermedius]MCF3634929.1 hypothetical protein [Komagataeibacter intermedius]GAN88484.1 hypothetical protein Gain_0207_015 [Komagataeibacter intermedius TF2]GBQ68622.1 hypothetical protein AA0521_1284 [Komagataeibacter intermedius NRIC 0521]
MKHSSPLPAAPHLFAEYLANAAPATWKGFRAEARDAYDELCEALSARQRGLCVFCEIDLITSQGFHAREIEHWRPKSLDQHGAMDWTFGINNLQLGCLGGSRRWPLADHDRTGDPKPGPNLSCGASKGNRDPALPMDGVLPYRPSDLPEGPTMFVVASNGEIRPVGNCAAHGLDAARLIATIAFLGLNCTRLKNAREAILRSLDEALLQYLENAEGNSEDERFDVAYQNLARDSAPDPVGNLPPFVSTIRSFFGPNLDPVLFPISGWSNGD